MDVGEPGERCQEVRLAKAALVKFITLLDVGRIEIEESGARLVMDQRCEVQAGAAGKVHGCKTAMELCDLLAKSPWRPSGVDPSLGYLCPSSQRTT